MCLRRISDHDPDEEPVHKCVDDAVMPLVCDDILCGARDGQLLAPPLFLLTLHVEGRNTCSNVQPPARNSSKRQADDSFLPLSQRLHRNDLS